MSIKDKARIMHDHAVEQTTSGLNWFIVLMIAAFFTMPMWCEYSDICMQKHRQQVASSQPGSGWW